MRSMIGAEFTRDDVLRAEARIGVTHPVLVVLDREGSRISAVTQLAIALPVNQDSSRYIRNNSGFLLDAIEDAAPFSLNPLEMVAIWSRNSEFRRHRYLMATALSIGYAIQGVTRPDVWRRLPRRFVEGGGLPSEVITDREGLSYVRKRFEEIETNLDILSQAVYGTSEPHVVLGLKLGKRMREGDSSAEQEYDALKALIEERKIPLLDDLIEAFGNGMSPIKLAVAEAIQ